MKLIITKENLIKALQKIIGVVEKRQTMPILSHVFFRVNGESHEVVASDLEVQLSSKVELEEGSDFSERVEEIRSRSKMCLSRDQLLAQNFDAVLAVIVKLAGDTIFAKFCQDALSHILRHPRSIQTRDVVGMAGMGWDGLV